MAAAAAGSHPEAEEGCFLHRDEVQEKGSMNNVEGSNGSARVQWKIEGRTCDRCHRQCQREDLPRGRHTWNVLSDRAEHTDSGLR